MHIKSILTIVVMAALLSAACGENNNENKKTSTSTLPALIRADSVELFYFNDPDGDSLRYTRYYSYLASVDTQLLAGLNRTMSDSATRYDSVRPCRSEGKIYMHAGSKPLRTLYFSTRCDSCCYIYYIRNGEFYYLPMKDNIAKRLMELKGSAQAH